MLLTQGRTATFGSIFKFMLGGMNGTVLSGAAQFGKTLILRSLFGWVWNFCSSQELDMPAFDTVLKVPAAQPGDLAAPSRNPLSCTLFDSL